MKKIKISQKFTEEIFNDEKLNLFVIHKFHIYW